MSKVRNLSTTPWPPTEKAMAPHSSTLVWKIPWMEEPGRLQSMGSLRVGHDQATSFSLFTFMHGEGNGNPLQCSCLENPRDRGAWWAAVCGVAQSRTGLKRLSSSSSLGPWSLALPDSIPSSSGCGSWVLSQINVMPPSQVFMAWCPEGQRKHLSVPAGTCELWTSWLALLGHMSFPCPLGWQERGGPWLAGTALLLPPPWGTEAQNHTSLGSNSFSKEQGRRTAILISALFSPC